MSETVRFEVQQFIAIDSDGFWVTLDRYNDIENAYDGMTDWHRQFGPLANPTLRVVKVTVIEEDCA